MRDLPLPISPIPAGIHLRRRFIGLRELFWLSPISSDISVPDRASRVRSNIGPRTGWPKLFGNSISIFLRWSVWVETQKIALWTFYIACPSCFAHQSRGIARPTRPPRSPHALPNSLEAPAALNGSRALRVRLNSSKIHHLLR